MPSSILPAHFMKTKTHALFLESYEHAVSYLNLKMATQIEWFRFEDKREEKAALSELRALGKAHSPKALAEFCSTWLSPERRKQLSAALRTKKSKMGLGKKSLTVSEKAYSLVKAKSSETGQTISDTLVSLFNDPPRLSIDLRPKLRAKKEAARNPSRSEAMGNGGRARAHRAKRLTNVG